MRVYQVSTATDLVTGFNEVACNAWRSRQSIVKHKTTLKFHDHCNTIHIVYFSETLELKTALLYDDKQPVVGL